MMKSKKHAKSAWVSNSSTTEKPWGSECRWAALPTVAGKILYIKEGHRNSLKYNNLKDECLFVLTGEVEVEFGNELSLTDPVANPFKKRVLEKGETLNVQSGCPYRITAHVDSSLIEIGSSGGAVEPETTITRIEDDYGRE